MFCVKFPIFGGEKKSTMTRSFKAETLPDQIIRQRDLRDLDYVESCRRSIAADLLERAKSGAMVEPGPLTISVPSEQTGFRYVCESTAALTAKWNYNAALREQFRIMDDAVRHCREIAENAGVFPTPEDLFDHRQFCRNHRDAARAAVAIAKRSWYEQIDIMGLRMDASSLEKMAGDWWAIRQGTFLFFTSRIGLRLGLNRVARMLTAQGALKLDPQTAFAAI